MQMTNDVLKAAARTLSGLVAVVPAVLLAACATNLGQSGGSTSSIAAGGGQETAGAPRKPVKIAMLLPLGGFDQTAAIAKSMKQAGEMALFEIDNPSVQLVVKDDKGTEAGARVAAEEAVKEGAEIILGPLFAKAVPGAASVARTAKIPVLAFSNDRQVAGNGVYLMSFLVEPEVERVVAFAASQGKKRFAALIPNDAYGKAVEPAFRQAVARAGGTIAELQTCAADANGMLEPAKRVFEVIKQYDDAGSPVDVLFLPGGQDTLPHLGPLIAYSGINTQRTKLLGTGGWEYPNLGRDDAFVGGWYASPDPRGWQVFSERFAKTFGSAPPRIASLAYDAVSIAISLSSNSPGARYTTANLTRAAGFSGVDGTVRFLPSGLSEHTLAVLEVQKFGSSVVDPAPGTLGNAQLSAAERRLQ